MLVCVGGRTYIFTPRPVQPGSGYWDALSDSSLSSFLSLSLFLFFFFFSLPSWEAEIQRQPINLNEEGKTNGGTIGEKLRGNITDFVSLRVFFYQQLSNWLFRRLRNSKSSDRNFLGVRFIFRRGKLPNRCFILFRLPEYYGRILIKRTIYRSIRAKRMHGYISFI